MLATAADGGASALYERLEFNLAGMLPGYALKPHGGLAGALISWKQLGEKAEQAAFPPGVPPGPPLPQGNN
ncbi:hypothetical protein [Deinococcus metallilatus]|uniref:Uncharacterized protein n=1 Tax=Deinococcus metallilatus TaxID=1211322 RepID=A0ABR6MR01_9DEIO|nr:hypothetical protein [Deinococcus metallilatus]MBB5294129.1 hypothetical protein [Deinococcus metallilatus]GMA16535.1 hypothetical protein GCM10025871_28660 [Deinococcus metallilatus]